MRKFTLPDLGEGLEEAEIVAWDVNEGDHVVTDQPLGSAKSLAGAGPAERLRGMRRVMAQRMAASHAEVAPANVTEEADSGDWPRGTDVSSRLIRAIVAAAKIEPALNAWSNSQAGERRLV